MSFDNCLPLCKPERRYPTFLSPQRGPACHFSVNSSHLQSTEGSKYYIVFAFLRYQFGCSAEDGLRTARRLRHRPGERLDQFHRGRLVTSKRCPRIDGSARGGRGSAPSAKEPVDSAISRRGAGKGFLLVCSPEATGFGISSKVLRPPDACGCGVGGGGTRGEVRGAWRAEQSRAAWARSFTSGPRVPSR